jgi:hypothetical protein
MIYIKTKRNQRDQVQQQKQSIINNKQTMNDLSLKTETNLKNNQ